MCGIFGYKGKPINRVSVLEGLRKLEYRGYDSCGYSACDKSGFSVIKSLKGVQSLMDKDLPEVTSVICHTRWATTGEICESNSHPHVSYNRAVAIVHNGIIENYQDIKLKLIEEYNYQFIGDTDSEVIANLIDKYYVIDEYSEIESIKHAINDLEGTYALAIQFLLGDIYCVRKSNPLFISKDQSDNIYISSDTSAFPQECTSYFNLQEGHIYDLNNLDVSYSAIDDKDRLPELGDYDHFMLKEIYEECESAANAFNGRLSDTEILLGGLKNHIQKIKSSSKIYIVGCGSSYYAGMLGKYWIEKYSCIPTEVLMASNLKSLKYIKHENEVAFFISQSGETADIIHAIEVFKSLGITCFGIVNRINSSIALLTDAGVYIHAGVEVGVAATKSFINQLVVLYLIALSLSYKLLPENIELVKSIPSILSINLSNIKELDGISKLIAEAGTCYLIGSNYDYAIALEGALKLKEISYINSEAFYSGELKHGPLALISNGTPVIILDNSDESILITNNEIKSRGGVTIGLQCKNKTTPYDYIINYEEIVGNRSLNTIPMIQLLQLIAYKVAILLSRDPDKPRNLAKSVTVR